MSETERPWQQIKCSQCGGMFWHARGVPKPLPRGDEICGECEFAARSDPYIVDLCTQINRIKHTLINEVCGPSPKVAEERDNLRRQLDEANATIKVLRLQRDDALSWVDAVTASASWPRQRKAATMSSRAEVWYVRGPEREFEEFSTEREAKEEAHAMLQNYRERASDDGWPSDIDRLEWGRLEPREVAEVKTIPAPEDSPFDEYLEVSLRSDEKGGA